MRMAEVWRTKRSMIIEVGGEKTQIRDLVFSEAGRQLLTQVIVSKHPHADIINDCLTHYTRLKHEIESQ